METLKNVLGLGASAPTTKEESIPEQHPHSGQEPVSGQLGAGTATDPYDAGNAEGQSGSAPGQPLQSSLPKDSDASEPLKDNKTLSLGDNPTSSLEENPSSLNEKSLSSYKEQNEPSLNEYNASAPGYNTTSEIKYNNTSYLNSTDVTTPFETPAPSSQPREDISSYPGLHGHPPPNTDFSAATFEPDRQEAQADEPAQTQDYQPQSHQYASKAEGQDTTSGRGYAPQEYETQGSSETKPFVEREAERIAKETAAAASRPSTENNNNNNTGPTTSASASATVPDNTNTTDQDLAESTGKKLHLKDRIKEKLHIRKKSENT